MNLASRALQRASRYLKILSILPKTRDYYISSRIIDHQLEIFRDTDNGESRLIIKALGAKLIQGKHDFIVSGMHLVKPLVDKLGAVLEIINDEVLIAINGIKLNVETYEELIILNEIFIEGVYNFISPKPVIVVDIGMNTGFTSLFLANQPFVSSVIAYEPFKKTYQQALKNLALNPKLAKKVKALNFGVSDIAKSITVDYCYSQKGSLGIDGLPAEFQVNEEISKVDIHLISASEAIDQIQADYPNIEIVAKIDCEGSEYDIIKDLALHGKLRSLRSIFLEWHTPARNPELIKLLSDANFNVLHFTPYSNRIGMLYASRETVEGMVPNVAMLVPFDKS